MTSFPNSNKLFIENYKILQSVPEHEETRPSHNYHTVDLVSSIVDTPNFEKFLVALNIDRSGSMGTVTKDGNSVLQYTLHTVKALIDYLEEIKKNNKQLNIETRKAVFGSVEPPLLLECIIDEYEKNLKYRSPYYFYSYSALCRNPGL